MANKKICVFGTFHYYQLDVYRPQFINELSCLAEIHTVDVILEEAVAELITIPRVWAKKKASLPWVPVDLNRDERKGIPDKNPCGIGTLVDLDFQNARERAWVERTAKAVKVSGLFICGGVHTLSVAQKFIAGGFDVEVHTFIDRSDDLRIKEANFDSPEWLKWPLSSNEL
jgi:hypothetical protein